MRSTTKGLLFLTSSSLLIVAASYLAACGGDDSTATGTDAGADTSSTATPPPPPPPPPPTDGGSDGGCTADNQACTTDTGSNGLCKAGVCSPCADPGDDPACKAAYAGTLCLQGICAPGDCRANTDCTGGKICGLTTPNTCGACTSDTACKTAYGTDYVCNTTSGGCITNTMACTTGTDAGACVGNAGDVCCLNVASDAGACLPGNCCSDTQCAARDATKPLCVNNTCTSCPAVIDGKYYVDTTVSAGQDAIASGSINPTATCAFKTLTHALSAIGTAKAAPVQVIILGDDTVIGAGETFPIIVPPYVTITSANPAKPAKVQVAAGKDGFVLSYANSGLSHIIVDGQAKTANNGVIAQTGSSSTTTLLDHVTVQNFLQEGITVTDAAGKTTGGALAIAAGTVSTGNGQRGALVNGHGALVVNVTSGDPVHFDNNGEAGIRVSATGQLTLTGAVGATPPTTGTVTTNGNGTAGLAVEQTAGAASLPANVITGLTAWNNKASGVRVAAGSTFKLRSSSTLKNAANGVHIRYATTSGGTIINDTANIDLGSNTTTEAGKNVLQDLATGNANTGAGVCNDVQGTANANHVVNALGNTFVSAATAQKAAAVVDCSLSASTGTVLSRATGSGACTNSVSVGSTANAASGNVVNTTYCN